MTQGKAQALLAAAAGLTLLVSVYLLARRGRISFRYTVGWIALCFLGIVSGVLVPLVGPAASWMRITPAALVTGIAIFMVLAICVQFSISISGMQEQIRRLTEELAHLRLLLDEGRHKKR